MTLLVVILCILAAGIVAVLIVGFFEGETMFRDFVDEWRIARADLAELDRRNATRTEKSDVVVSLTTIPSRIGSIDDTLKSLLRQTVPPREIRLHLPRHSRRENRAYDVPERIARLQSVRIVACEDFGPATKFLPALQSLSLGDMLIAVDDDRIYPPSLVADLAAAARATPDAAFGLSGWVVPDDLTDRSTTILSNLLERPPAPLRARRQRANRPIDILQGFSGYLVRPGFFDLAALADFSAAPPAAFTTDDVWIAAHCRVPKFVIPARRTNFPPRRHFALHKRTSLGWLNRGATDADRKNSIMLRYFADVWRARGVLAGRMSGTKT